MAQGGFQGGFKAWVERRAAPYAAMGMIVGMVARSAQVYSLGTFSIASLPPLARSAYDLLTGLCIAAGMELMMGAAGAKWWKLREAAALTLFDNAIPVKDRQARMLAVKEKARLYLYATIFAAVASFGAIVSFAVSGGHLNLAAAGADVVIAFITIGGVGFFSIMYEPEEPDALGEASAAVTTTVFQQANQIAGRIADGSHKPEDIAFLKRTVRDPDTAHMLDALTPRDTTVEYLDTPAIMRWLRLDSDADARDIRRRMKRAKDNGEDGVRAKPDGRGLEAAQTVLLALFGDRLEQRIAAAVEARSAASQRDAERNGASASGQATDRERRAVVAVTA